MHPPQHVVKVLELLADDQAGLISRRQIRELGIGRSWVVSHLRGRRWRRILPGVYATFTGPLPPLSRIWAGLLYAGPAAVTSHATAAFLTRLVAEPPEVVDVSVPHGTRHPTSRRGVRVRQSRLLHRKTHPSRRPPQTTVEETVLDIVNEAIRAERVIDLVLGACQRRLTTRQKLGAAAAARRRLRWRRLVRDLLTEVREGVQSTLERRYRSDVEVAHGLPRGRRNRAERSLGRREYRDVRYWSWKLIVELDGQAAHPPDLRERDDLRDNAILEMEDVRTLRYGWRSVTAEPCRTAAQVARLLRLGGWTGQLRACGPTCTALDS